MTQQELDDLMRKVLESQDDDERQINLGILRQNTQNLITDYDTVLGEKDSYKEKYEKANDRNIDLFLRVSDNESKFKDDSENQGDNPKRTLKEDKIEDNKDNQSYDSLIENMKGELF